MRYLTRHRAQRYLFALLLALLTACGDNTAQTNPTATLSAPATTQPAVAATTTGVAATTVAATTAPVVASPSPAAATTAPATSVPPATTAPATTPTLQPGTFVNPILDQDFPDPDVMKVGNTYYAYATNSSAANIQEAKSTDLVHWQVLNDALPDLPAWAEKGHTWAPGVTTAADGKTYVMYYVARDSASSKQCIGVATSKMPEGPFTSSGSKPFICQLDQGGSIDPSAFVDADGTHYVVWKNDGNCCGLDTYLYLQKVSADDLTLTGQPTKLIHEDQAWEGNLVEAPVLWKHGSKYFLFYSANSYAGADYAIGYAVADSISGPYHKPQGPFVKTVPAANGHDPVIGPGGEAIVTDKTGQTWMLYHDWDPTVSYRRMNIDKLTWNGDTPVLNGPNVVPEPAPAT